jgi:arginase
MKETLLCLNPEWQGCESPILESGAIGLSEDLFGGRSYINFGSSIAKDLKVIDSVFALDVIGSRFIEALKLLRSKRPKRIFTVGGSCGTEAAPVSFLNEVHEGEMAVIWFDAHGDLNTPDSSPSGHFHGMVLRTLLGEGPEVFTKNISRPLVPNQIFLAGARDLDIKEKEYIASIQLKTLPVDKSLVEEISIAGFRKVYIHLDLDVINPENFNDALMPTLGGPTIEVLSQCLSTLSINCEVVGVGIVEYCGRHPESGKKIAEILVNGGITNR